MILPILTLAISLVVLFALPYATYRLGPDRRRHVLVPATALAAILGVAVHLGLPIARLVDLRNLGPLALALFVVGLLVSFYIAILGSPGVSLSNKYGVTAVLAALPVVVTQDHLARGGADLVSDISTRIFVRLVERINLPATPRSIAATDQAMAYIQMNVLFLQRHMVGIATFLVLVAGWVLLDVIRRVLPGLMREGHSLGSLRSVRLLGPRTGLPLLALLLALYQLWPGPIPPVRHALDLVLGVFAAEGLSLLVLLGVSVPRARLWAAAATCACLVYLPWSGALCLVGVIDCALGARSLLPPVRGRLSLLDRRVGPGRVATAVAGCAAAFLVLHALTTIILDVQESKEVEKGPDWTLVEPEDRRGPAKPGAGDMVRIARPGKPFLVDRYEQPNEPGAPSTTGVTSRQARKSCERQGKRLCDEEEWRLLCVATVEEEFRAREIEERCASTGSPPAPGSAPACQTERVLQSMVGKVWQWTTPVSNGPLDHFMVLKGTCLGATDDMRSECSYRRFVHAVEEPSIDFSVVSYRCCRDASDPEGEPEPEPGP